MKHSHPAFEAVKPNIGSSFTSLKFLRNENIKSHVWHYHPEIELIFVCGGSGKRQIGSNISYFSDGDLVLMGSNLPHCGMTNENTNNDYEMVIQFKPDFLGENFFELPEMQKISALLEKSKAGIVFFGKYQKTDRTENCSNARIFILRKTGEISGDSGCFGFNTGLQNSECRKILSSDSGGG